MMEFQNNIGKKFKVTRRLPNLLVAERKVFTSKEEAKKTIRRMAKVTH